MYEDILAKYYEEDVVEDERLEFEDLEDIIRIEELHGQFWRNDIL